MDELYDRSSASSILEYARQLLGTSIRRLHPEASSLFTGKGRLGKCVEKYHFKYEPNNDAKPDFDEAGIELKCTPLKKLDDGSMVSKERLVLNIIDYLKEADKTFETSSFWHKNQHLLLMFYLHEKGVNVIDLVFKIIRLWKFPEVDLKIIKDDWEKIHYKLAHGLAHEISEGDTLYLGACTKGSKSGAEKRKQKNSDILADQRAYSLKSKYLNSIILESLLHPEMCSGLYISKLQKRKTNIAISETSKFQPKSSSYSFDRESKNTGIASAISEPSKLEPEKNIDLHANDTQVFEKEKVIPETFQLNLENNSNFNINIFQKKIIKKANFEVSYLVKSVDEYQESETFEELVERKFKPYYGKTIKEIEIMLGEVFTFSPKAISNAVVHGILGVKTPKIAEFEKANLQQKTIRLENNGNLKESMVFSQIKYNEIVNEERWEDSEWYQILTQRFLFIVFRKDSSDIDKLAKLEKVFFWTMPPKDLEVAKMFWLDTKDKIKRGDFEHFISISDDKICHVRPKAKDSSDKMDTPYGPQLKRGYWLNRQYILNIVNRHLKSVPYSTSSQPVNYEKAADSWVQGELFKKK